MIVRGRAVRRGGFTLGELLVSVALIGLLVALSVPVYRRVLEGSRATACVSNLRQIGTALNVYLGEHNMMMPSLRAGRTKKTEEMPVIDNALAAYLPDPRAFACPADRSIAAESGTSYFWNTALNGQSLANLRFLLIADPGKIPIVADKEGFHPYEENKVNLLYADGHATKELRFFAGS